MKRPRLYSRQDAGVDSARLFSILCCMRYLLTDPDDDWDSFVGGLSDLLEEYKPYVKESDLGLIPGWKAKLKVHTETSLLEQLLNA